MEEEINSSSKQTKLLIGELLKEHGYITQELIDIALKVQKIDKKYLGEVLLSLNFVTAQEIAIVIAKQSNVQYIDIDTKVIN